MLPGRDGNCPIGLCKGKLVKRVNSSSKKEFYGCSNYPKCTYTEPIEESDEDTIKDAASVWE